MAAVLPSAECRVRGWAATVRWLDACDRGGVLPHRRGRTADHRLHFHHEGTKPRRITLARPHGRDRRCQQRLPPEGILFRYQIGFARCVPCASCGTHGVAAPLIPGAWDRHRAAWAFARSLLILVPEPAEQAVAHRVLVRRRGHRFVPYETTISVADARSRATRCERVQALRAATGGRTSARCRASTVSAPSASRASRWRRAALPPSGAAARSFPRR